MILKHVEDLPSPEGVFEMVMDYAKRIKKNPWISFAQAFSPDYMTVVVVDDDGDYAGYYTGHITYDPECELFINQGYFKYPIKDAHKIADKISIMMSEKSKTNPVRIVQHSFLSPRLWEKRYGFELSKERIFTKTFPKEV